MRHFQFALLSLFVLAFSCLPLHAQYSYERTITIDHTKVPNTDQASFPVLISGTYSYLATVANGGRVRNANGFDIILAREQSGTVRLDHEIESYDPSTGTISFWVRIPTLSHTTDTIIYFLYGNSSITTSQENKTGVWDSNYKGIWHFANGTSLNVNDSTSNGANGTNSGATATAGQIDGAASFNGSSQINIAASGSLTAPFTIEAWAKPSSFNGYSEAGLCGSRSPQDYGSDVTLTSSGLHGIIGTGSSWITTNADASYSYTLNTWHHVAYAVSTSGYSAYADGASRGSGTLSGTALLYDTNHTLTIGTSGYPGDTFTVTIDEVRVSNIIRSADWIATEYNNQNSPSTFYSSGTESTPPALSSISVTPANPSVPLGSSQQFTATGNYSDSSTHNFTTWVTWGSSQPGVASINSTGLATTLTQGSTSISATLGSMVGSTTLTVSPPAVVSIAVTPGNLSIVQNATWQFSATGTYSDGTTQNLTSSATWSSSSTTVATINSSGLATTLTPGTSTITALSGSVSGLSPLSVVSSSTGPTITNLSLAQAAVGGTVTITGTNFGTTQGFSVVTFNGVSAGLCSPTPSCWSSSSISIKVPVGATSGNVVMNVNGVYSNRVSLAIVPPPVITGVTPFWIPVGGAMTINGSSFGPSGTVTVNCTTASITSWSGSSVSVTSRRSLTPSASTPWIVSAEGLASQPFTFTTHVAPAIGFGYPFSADSICLINGNPTPENCVTQGAIGAPVYIVGSNLGELQGDSTVTFGGVQATQIQQEGTGLIAATVPSGITPLPTTVNVVVNR